MTTITRRQLQDAIEAGITAAEVADDFTAEHAAALRTVGEHAIEVGRGSYDDKVPCPAALAIPGISGLDLTWVSGFARRYDDVTWDMIKALGLGCGDGFVLHITEDNDEREAAVA